MIIVLKNKATKKQVKDLLKKIEKCNLKPLHMPGTEKTVLGAIGDERVLEKLHLESNPIVDRVIPILSSYKLASRELHNTETVISINGRSIGNPYFTIIAGPCAIEDRKQVMDTAKEITKHNVVFMRGGAFKPRTSPYSFQGLGEKGLKLFQEAKKKYGILVVTEVLNQDDLELISKYADILQVGARNMQNFSLLKKVGRSKKPVLLKRGLSATIKEFLMCAEYILSEGNQNVILCERGIRTFETEYRNTLDLTSIPIIKQKTHLPIIIDPSHAAGNRDYVVPLAKAALVSGADGIIVEIHPRPDKAKSDGKQSLYFDQFNDLINQLKKIAEIENKILQ